MATYKVPQDVEADDKLLGPFTFRQFIYLIIVALAIALAWGLAQLFVGLAIIPIPIILFFGALALPLRKDQPMEIYMAAIVSFYIKPRLRRWDPEGVESLIEISAPKVVEMQRTKVLSQDEAQQRLSYLANIVDSQGWAIRGVAGTNGTAMNTDVYLEAQGAEDVLDTNTSVAQNFDKMMTESTERVREEARQRMFQPEPAQPLPQTPQFQQQAPQMAYQQTNAYQQPQQPVQQAYAAPVVNQAAAVQPVVQASTEPVEVPEFNPYPTIHQSVIQPLGDEAYHADTSTLKPEVEVAAATAAAIQAAASTQAPREVPPKEEEKPASTSDSTLTAGIMNLANNPDLSIETIAHQANRLKKKAEEESEEVIISLR